MNDRYSPPSPGFHYDVPAAAYFRWDAVNCSALRKMADCAASYAYACEHPQEPTPSMLQGSLGHCAILEPGMVAGRYLVAGQCTAVKDGGKGSACSNAGKALSGGRWYCGVHARGREQDGLPMVLDEDGGAIRMPVVSQAMMDDALAMRASVGRNRAAMRLMEGARYEVCAVWVDPDTGLTCKARLDAYHEGRRQVSDVKTCESSAPSDFADAVARHNYDMQAAFYLDGASIASGGIAHEEFYFIAVAKEGAHVCAVYKASKGMIDLGRDRYRRMLADYKWCKENNRWPGYADHQIVELNVPRWFFEKESRK